MVRRISTKTSIIFIITILAAVLLSACENSLDAYIETDELQAQEAGILAAPIININGSVITGHEEITLTFDETIDKTTLSLGGTLGDSNPGTEWGQVAFVDDKVYINSDNYLIWPEGSGKTLTVSCESVSGKVLTGYSFTSDVFYGVCVSPPDDAVNPGKPSNPGTVTGPLDTIQVGIDKADTMYVTPANGIDTAEVRVAGGNYEKVCEISTPTYIANMINEISLFGGYSFNFQNRDISNNITNIVDTSTIGGVSEAAPVSTVYCDSTIGTSTVIDGFSITLGSDDGIHCAIHCQEGSPTISNITISGSGSGDENLVSYGIYLYSSTAKILNSTIDPGHSTAYSAAIVCSQNADVTIDGNTIYSGTSDDTYGIKTDTSSDSIITNNTITGGNWSSEGYCIRVRDCNPTITENIFNISHGTYWATYAIYERTTNSDPSSLRENDFNYQGNWYYDEYLTTVDSTNYNTQQLSTLEGSALLLTAIWGNYSTSENLP